MSGKGLFLVLLCLVVHHSSADYCMQNHMKCFDAQVDKYLNDQIQAELQAQMTYLTLAQKFDSYDNYYPKIAAFLRAKSAEELTHAERFIEYQNQRGGSFDFSSVQTYTCSDSTDDITGALKCALDLEKQITGKLTDLQRNVQNVGKLAGCVDGPLEEDNLLLSQPIIVKLGQSKSILPAFGNCDSIALVKLEYVELAEMIAHEYLSHQVKDIKELANMYMTMKSMITKDEKRNGLANYLFDKNTEL